MLSLILISLKQNTTLLIEAQLKHGGNKKQGLRPPQRRWLQQEGWSAHCMRAFGLSSPRPAAHQGPVSTSSDKGCMSVVFASPTPIVAEGKSLVLGPPV